MVRFDLLISTQINFCVDNTAAMLEARDFNEPAVDSATQSQKDGALVLYPYAHIAHTV